MIKDEYGDTIHIYEKDTGGEVCEVVTRDYYDTSTGRDTKLFVMNCGPDMVRNEFPAWTFCPYCGKPIHIT